MKRTSAPGLSLMHGLLKIDAELINAIYVAELKPALSLWSRFSVADLRYTYGGSLLICFPKIATIVSAIVFACKIVK